MRTFTCLAALFLLAAAVSAAPVNEDEWSEETVGTDTALTLFDTAGTAEAGAIPACKVQVRFSMKSLSTELSPVM